MQNQKCQLQFLNEISEPITGINRICQRRNRLKRIFKRRLIYLSNLFSEIIGSEKKESKNTAKSSTIDNLKPGDTVRIKSREDIKATLNRWNQLKGCAFMEEMWPYCGTTHRVFKRIEKFLDERDYLIKKCNNIVILEGVFCEGTKDYGPCDRSCFLFWREEWLERIEAELT